MDKTMEGFEDLRSNKNPKARIKVMKGHFATSNSHLNTYIDMSTVKTRHHNSREAARVLANEYLNNTYVNTIVCLDETEVIGTFLAEELADTSRLSLSADNNISVITPEYNALGQTMFRDNKPLRSLLHKSIVSATRQSIPLRLITPLDGLLKQFLNAHMNEFIKVTLF